MSSITFSGLASGLDSKAIIQALLAVERRPIQQLESRKKTFQSQRNLFGQFETKLQELRDKADAIRKSSEFLAFKANLDRDEYLTASAGTGAVAGTYRLDVQQLATAQVSSTDTRTLTSKDDKIFGSGSLTFTVGSDSFDVDLTEEFNSLQDVADAINGKDGLDLNASVLEVESGKFKLVVSSKSTGSEQAFSVTGSNGMTDIASELTTNTTAAQDAKVLVNDILVTRSSNSISDVIDGVTLNLKKADTNVTTTLTVSADGGATAAKIQEFVDAYNQIVDFVEGQSEVDEKGATSAALFGDSTLRSIRTTLRGVLGGSVDTGNSAYSMLSQIGVSSDTDGKLTFDKSKFEEAVANDEDAVKNLFSDATNGLATRMYSQVDGYLDTVDGLLATRKKGIDTRIKDIDKQIDRGEQRLDRMEISLVQKYANLEILMGRLQSQGGALGALQNLGQRSN